MSLLVCEDKDCRVVVDRKARAVRFERCHIARSWVWPRGPSAEFTCAFDDVLAVHLFRAGEYNKEPTAAAVVTKHGRAILSLSAPGARGVLDFLRDECAGRGPGPWLQNPSNERLLVVVLLVAGFGGFAVWVRWFSGWVAH
jgi:hypothetical protein